MSMPRIASACVRASAGVLATLMPPAFPRPPTWTCAFTTQGPDPIARAAATTSAGVVATRPSGMAIPARARTCFAWNSWSFTGEAEDSPSARCASRDAYVPLVERRRTRARASGRPHREVAVFPHAAMWRTTMELLNTIQLAMQDAARAERLMADERFVRSLRRYPTAALRTF